MKWLIEIQNELKVKKDRLNSYGGFNYRSAEDILEAVKPLLKKAGALLTIDDNIINIGNFNYIESTATIRKDKESISTHAFAREPISKSGMDDSQLTGSTSSYARKYALSGLFLLDDGNDSDSQTDSKDELINESQLKVLKDLLKETNSDEGKFLTYYHVDKLEEFTQTKFLHAQASLSRKVYKNENS